MGMFDLVYINCPHCGESIEEQSKAGYCNFGNYDLSNLPPAIAGDLHNETGKCPACEKYYRIITQCLVNVIQLKEPEDEDE